MNKINHIVVAAFVCVVVFGMQTHTAQAQFYSNDYYQTRASIIAQIQSLLAQIARLDAQASQRVVINNQSTNGRVLGAQFGTSNVEVQTFTAGVADEDSVKLYGEVDLNGATYADVWFRYGRTQSMLDQTPAGRISRNTSDSFRADISGLREDTRYYYQAVAEDSFGRRAYSTVYTFNTDDRSDRRRSDDDEPEVDVDRARSVGAFSATLEGEVDMNDFKNGLVFFAYGEDEDQIEDIADDHDEYRDIDEDGDDLQLIKVDSDLDRDASYEARVTGLDDDTDIFFTLCVEYEDEDDDETIECGDVEEFETDRF